MLENYVINKEFKYHNNQLWDLNIHVLQPICKLSGENWEPQNEALSYKVKLTSFFDKLEMPRDWRCEILYHTGEAA